MSPPEAGQLGSEGLGAGTQRLCNPGRSILGGSTAMGTGEARWARGMAAKGMAEPALLSPLLGGSRCSQQTQQAKCCWVFNGKKNPTCRSADPASLPYPSRSPEEGKIPLRSSAERNLASVLMDWGPGDPKAAASLAAEVLEQEQRPTTQPAAPQGLCFSPSLLEPELVSPGCRVQPLPAASGGFGGAPLCPLGGPIPHTAQGTSRPRRCSQTSHCGTQGSRCWQEKSLLKPQLLGLGAD